MFSVGQRVQVHNYMHHHDIHTITEVDEEYHTYKIDCQFNCAVYESDLILAKDISDGYHTFSELYSHRMMLTATVCALLNTANYWEGAESGYSYAFGRCYRSWQHHPDDGPMFDNMFIVVLELPTNGTVRQISYHYNAEHWDVFWMCPVVEHAPKWDGHTPQDTLTILRKYNVHGNIEQKTHKLMKNPANPNPTGEGH